MRVRYVQAALTAAALFSIYVSPISAESIATAGHEPRLPRPVIIDTDPGMGYLFRDIDDGLMLVAALQLPEIDVLAVTTTFGNVGHDAAFRKAKEIVRRTGQPCVSVYPGSPFAGAAPENNAAAQYIVDQVKQRPGEVTILATGPLTNVAAALALDAEIAGLTREIVAVGGLIRRPGEGAGGMPYDLNFGSDPAAARAVLASGAPVTLVHIEMCIEFMSRRGQLSDLLAETGDIERYLRRQTRSWRMLTAGTIVLWDVVGLHYLVRPSWYDTMQLGVRVRVDTDGLRPVVTVEVDGASPNTVTAPLAVDDVEAYWLWLRDSLRPHRPNPGE